MATVATVARSRSGRALGVVVALVVGAATLVVATPAVGAQTADGLGPDFDGDGYGDVVVGTPNESFGDRLGAGSVTILYGSAAGTTTDGAQLWHQGKRGVPGRNELGDHWGFSWSAGDLNGDGFDDLVVSAPGEGFGERARVGSITILYGSSRGLRSAGAQLFHQNKRGVPGRNTDNDGWGTTLAVGDVNGDGFGDVLIGAPDKDPGGVTDAGTVTVLFGSGGGVRSSGAQYWHQNKTGVPGTNDENDSWSQSLAVGDFNNDDIDDLAVGAPRESANDITWSGAVTVLYGTRNGLTGSGAQQFEQAAAFGQVGGGWGSALAAGDFDDNGATDLAIGAPGLDVGELANVGQVTVIPGGHNGLDEGASMFFSQESPGVASSSETGDNWGSALVAADMNGDGRDDLAVGAPGEGFGPNAAAGAVTFLPGSTNGLTGTNSTIRHQNSRRVPNRNEPGDQWATHLSAVDANGNGRVDLAVYAPFEGIGDVAWAGSVTVLPGRRRGPSGRGALQFHQDVDGVPGVNEASDAWGGAILFA